jgi:hypothetical protein
MLTLIGCASVGPANRSVTPTADGRSVAQSERVAVDSDLTEIAQVGGQVVLSIDVTNLGRQDIPQLTLIVNDAYIAGMSVQDTSPDSIRHNEQGGEYFIFGALASGKTGHYVIRMIPLSAGELAATIDVANWSPVDMEPLLLADGGQAHLSAITNVVPQ